MTRMARSHKKEASGLSIMTLGLIAMGIFLFYFGSQMVTPMDAHALHWGLAALGGVAGWRAGSLVERMRRDV